MSQKAVVLFLAAVSVVSADISKVFYINLDTSTTRRAHMEKELVAFAGNVERVSAISREHVNEYDSYVDKQGISENILGKADLSEIKATVGCWLSHTKLLERLTKELRAEEHAMILEDDVFFPQGWDAKLASVISTAPADWDILKVCGWGEHREQDAVNENWMLARGPFVFPSYSDPKAKFHYAGSCGYVVSGRSVERVVKHLHHQVIADFDSALLSDAAPSHPIKTYSMRQLLLQPMWNDDSTIHADSRRLDGHPASTGPPTGPPETTTAPTAVAAAGANELLPSMALMTFALGSGLLFM